MASGSSSPGLAGDDGTLSVISHNCVPEPCPATWTQKSRGWREAWCHLGCLWLVFRTVTLWVVSVEVNILNSSTCWRRSEISQVIIDLTFVKAVIAGIACNR